MKITWTGVFPAVTTKFKKDYSLDFKAFELNLDEQISAGVDGIIIGGTLGESSVLSNQEKNDLLRFAIEKIKGKIPVILNIAEGSTSGALREAESAAKAGVSGLMILPPM